MTYFFNHIASEVNLLIIKDITEKVEQSYDCVYSETVISLCGVGVGDGYVEFFRRFIDISLESLMDCEGLEEFIKMITGDFYWDKHKELVDRGIIDGDGELVGRKE